LAILIGFLMPGFADEDGYLEPATGPGLIENYGVGSQRLDYSPIPDGVFSGGAPFYLVPLGALLVGWAGIAGHRKGLNRPGFTGDLIP
jgi:hypothetical protein